MNKGKNKSEITKMILEEVGKTLILSTAIVSLVGYSFKGYIQHKVAESEKDDTGLRIKVYVNYDKNDNVNTDYINILENYSGLIYGDSEEQSETSEEKNNENEVESLDNEFDNGLIHAEIPEKTILEKAGIYHSTLDNMAKEHNEELIIQEDKDNVKNVVDLLYDVYNDGVSRQHKLNTICQLYNCTYQDIYMLYEIFVNKIDESPTTNPYEEIKNICACITNPVIFNAKCNNLIAKKGLNSEDINLGTNELISEYLNYKTGNSVDILINTLYYKQIKGIPLETKLNYIYERWGINEEQLTVLIDCVLCEATHHSYIDAYAVINSIMNRMCSRKWTAGYGDIYDQLTRRFGVYKRGDYKCYTGLTIEDLLEKYEGAPAVIDCLFSELSIHNTTNFYGNGYEREDRIKFTARGNNFFNENNQLSPEDRIPAEEVQQIIFDKNITLLFPNILKEHSYPLEYYFSYEEEEDTLTRVK